MPNISIWEMLLLLLVLLLVFGPKRLPEMGRSLGRGMREFKDSVSGITKDEPEKVELTPPAQQTAAPAPTPAPAAAQEPVPAPAAPAQSEPVSR
jgi:sec-independent protein translocase protein TatA